MGSTVKPSDKQLQRFGKYRLGGLLSPEQEHFLRVSNKILEKTKSRSAEVNKVAKRKAGGQDAS